ncbi:MAG: hypothetical protein ACRC62_15120 [Microcoleus sp.]
MQDKVVAPDTFSLVKYFIEAQTDPTVDLLLPFVNITHDVRRKCIKIKSKSCFARAWGEPDLSLVFVGGLDILLVWAIDIPGIPGRSMLLMNPETTEKSQEPA